MILISRLVLVSFAFTLLFPITAFAQQSPTATTIKIAEGVYMLKGRGGNIGASIGDDGVVLIDDQIAPFTEHIQAALEELTAQPVRFVLNTHWHHDHTHGNENFSKAGAVIVSHENARGRMIVEQIIVPPMTGGSAPSLPEDGWPVVTFTDNLSFHMNSAEMRVIHVENAHTDGDVLVHFVEADVMHMGDVYFSNGYPNIDVGSNGTIDGMIKAQKLALSLISENGKIIPGHGDLATPAQMTENIEMLETVSDRIAALIDKGLSMAEVVADRPLDDLDLRWGQGFVKQERMVIQAYKSLTPRAEWED